jgi:ABC-type lipoprotein release transport system permease subunit
MIAFKLAYRNMIGAGLRTWLTVSVLAFTFVMIVMQFGFLRGWNLQASSDMINWEVGGGQYHAPGYDPWDMFTLEDSHSIVPASLNEEISNGTVAPVLISMATIFPQGRMRTILMKGIDPKQNVLDLPSNMLTDTINEIPVIVGSSMARTLKMQEGDITTIRWRDKNGTFDAAEIVITGIFHTNVPTVDAAQIWMPLERLQEMTGLYNEATIIVVSPSEEVPGMLPGWEFKDTEYLMRSITETIKTKSIGSSFIYLILLGLGLLAVFDTQVLSIFRRQKEIGTYIAMGMTRKQVVGLFTVEGALHSVLALVVGAVVGIPFLVWMSRTGIAMPAGSESYGLALAERIYPSYGAGLVLISTILVVVTTTIVSYLPSRKISKMNPTEAIRGKIQ